MLCRLKFDVYVCFIDNDVDIILLKNEFGRKGVVENNICSVFICLIIGKF